MCFHVTGKIHASARRSLPTGITASTFNTVGGQPEPERAGGRDAGVYFGADYRRRRVRARSESAAPLAGQPLP